MANERMTWRDLLADPLTTLAGVTAAVAILQTLPTDRWSTWVLAAAAFLGGAVARDKQRRIAEKPTGEKAETKPDDAA